jgi:hypothetical protein
MNLKSEITKWSLIIVFSQSVMMLSQANAQTYCSPSYVFGCTNWSNQAILLDSINWSIGGTSCTISDYKNLSTTLNAGVAYSMMVTNGNWCGCAGWMDFNLDGVFDTTENLYHLYAGVSATYTYNFSITVPSNIPTGTYRMRVIAGWGSDGYSVSSNGYGGCGSYQYGNFDDFTIHVTGSSVGISNLANDNSQFIKISPNPATNFVIVSVKVFKGIEANLQLTDITGKIIQSLPVKNEKEILDISTLPEGIYILHYSDGIHHQSIRLSK